MNRLDPSTRVYVKRVAQSVVDMAREELGVELEADMAAAYVTGCLDMPDRPRRREPLAAFVFERSRRHIAHARILELARRAEEAFQQRMKHARAAREWQAVARDPSRAPVAQALAVWMQEVAAADDRAESAFVALARDLVRRAYGFAAGARVRTKRVLEQEVDNVSLRIEAGAGGTVAAILTQPTRPAGFMMGARFGEEASPVVLVLPDDVEVVS